ncbi:hypothetical protein DRQ33_07815 [bacterium]|nr:MAG: hypothetical protein DRQ33_07815 [bacterium]
MRRAVILITLLAIFVSIYAQIVVNEIMSNPPGTDEEEWVELFNISDSDVYLDSTWFISDGEGDYYFEGINIPSGGFLTILFRVPDTGEVHIVPDIDISEVSHGIRLANAEDDVIIGNSFGIIDSVTYQDSWAPDANNTGKSMERIHSTVRPNDPDNWDASIPDWGTPGEPNSITAIKEYPYIPDKFVISVTPNPFNSSCVISVNSDYTTYGKMLALDGKILHNWTLPAGDNEIIWAGKDMPSGLYIFTAKARHQQVSVPVLLIR